MTRGDGSGDGVEAAWQDLIARFDAPIPADGGNVPWPEREGLAGPVRVSPGDSQPGSAYPSDAISGPAGFTDVAPFPDTADVPLPEPPGFPDALGARPVPPRAPGGAGPGSAGPGSAGPGRVGPAGSRPGLAGPGRGPRDAPIPENPADEHFIPPPAPPLPNLNPITKGAWLALFGGPLYLIIATVAGWTVSGLAAFLAVAAFVGGFAVLVLRMDNGPPKDRGPDDGAVV
ncbi:MAG TPA: hypothetical protein VH478_09130 [Trebonia sp.]|jgi:hypothetical protein|nr:hypothetical protein [Trebonia sp.]